MKNVLVLFVSCLFQKINLILKFDLKNRKKKDLNYWLKKKVVEGTNITTLFIIFSALIAD